MEARPQLPFPWVFFSPDPFVFSESSKGQPQSSVLLNHSFPVLCSASCFFIQFSVSSCLRLPAVHLPVSSGALPSGSSLRCSNLLSSPLFPFCSFGFLHTLFSLGLHLQVRIFFLLNTFLPKTSDSSGPQQFFSFPIFLCRQQSCGAEALTRNQDQQCLAPSLLHLSAQRGAGERLPLCAAVALESWDVCLFHTCLGCVEGAVQMFYFGNNSTSCMAIFWWVRSKACSEG